MTARRGVVIGVATILWLVPTLAPSQTLRRTPDGQPDMQGVWVNFNRTRLEVWNADEDPPRLKALQKWMTNMEITPEGYRMTRWNLGAGGLEEALGEGTGDGHSAKRSATQRSLVVDPPTGRVPVRPEAEAQKNHNVLHMTDSHEMHTPWERCLTRGVPGVMVPWSYSSAYRILQPPGYVVIVSEMIHSARIIPLSTTAHVADGIRLWNGDSRGRWDGDTLVVETQNFRESPVGTIGNGVATSAPMKGIPQSAKMRLVERFAVVGPEEVRYEATIDDPDVYFAPWTISLPLHKDEVYEMYEYACHEGNYGLANSLRGARVEERSSANR